MGSKKIIIIDDEPDFVKNIKSFMELHGYDCLTARNGLEGLSVIEAERPVLVILDILMPNMDGYTMLRELKRREIDMKCIVITAKGRLKDLFELERVDRFLTKPFDLDKLLSNVQELLAEIPEELEAEEQVPDTDIENAKKGRVLVIEDQSNFANAIKNFLQMRGFEVFLAFSGEEGLSCVKDVRPDVVVTDIMMPGLDGYSMVKEMRRENRDLPIIVMSAKEKLKDFISLEGVDFFIAKPFELEVLESKINELI